MKADLEKLKYHLSLVIDCGGDPVYEQLKDIVEELEVSRKLLSKIMSDGFSCAGCVGCDNCQLLEAYQSLENKVTD